MIVPRSAHLGAQVSALLDGQLPEDLAERARAHLSACPACRSAVQREDWVKRGLSRLPDSAPPPGLTALLAGLPAAASGDVTTSAGAGLAVAGRWPERAVGGRGGRVTAAAIGVGSLSAALVVLGAGYLADGRVEPVAPAGTAPVGGWVADLPAAVLAQGRGPAAHRLRRTWARMEP